MSRCPSPRRSSTCSSGGVSPVDSVRSLMGREVTSEAGQDIMSLVMQIRQSATKTAKRTARKLLP